MDGTALAVGLLLAGALAGAVLARLVGRRRGQVVSVCHVAERVRAVGKLVGLEVCAKEIATASSGWSWLPPVLLSQARVAMIFHFEKQYFVDLARIRPGDVDALGGGEFRLRLPAVESTVRLAEVTPYDIQDGRILGLFDVIPMNATRQRDLMRRAQLEAASLDQQTERRYRDEAQRSVERQLAALMQMFGVRVVVAWPEEPAVAASVPPRRPAQPARGAPRLEPVDVSA